MLKLKELYYDPNENTSSANRLYEAAKRNKIDVTMKQVQAFIKNQAAYQKTMKNDVLQVHSSCSVGAAE